MRGITAENVLLLARPGALAKLFAHSLLPFRALSQWLLLLKGSGAFNPLICMPANRSFVKGGNDRAPGGHRAGRVVLGHGAGCANSPRMETQLSVREGRSTSLDAWQDKHAADLSSCTCKIMLGRAKSSPGSAGALLLFARDVFTSKFCKWSSSSKFVTKF